MFQMIVDRIRPQCCISCLTRMISQCTKALSQRTTGAVFLLQMVRSLTASHPPLMRLHSSPVMLYIYHSPGQRDLENIYPNLLKILFGVSFLRD